MHAMVWPASLAGISGGGRAGGRRRGKGWHTGHPGHPGGHEHHGPGGRTHGAAAAGHGGKGAAGHGIGHGWGIAGRETPGQAPHARHHPHPVRRGRHGLGAHGTHGAGRGAAGCHGRGTHGAVRCGYHAAWYDAVRRRLMVIGVCTSGALVAGACVGVSIRAARVTTIRVFAAIVLSLEKTLMGLGEKAVGDFGEELNGSLRATACATADARGAVVVVRRDTRPIRAHTWLAHLSHFMLEKVENNAHAGPRNRERTVTLEGSSHTNRITPQTRVANVAARIGTDAGNRTANGLLADATSNQSERGAVGSNRTRSRRVFLLRPLKLHLCSRSGANR
eukprot:m.88501 g.88501  ORF g.88501 m.88501 type:complete len:335 (-) comp13627_c0_seq3:288-1292(-)